MKSIKFWRIGTSINSYIDTVLKLSRNADLSKAKFVFETLPNNNDQMLLVSKNTGKLINFGNEKPSSRSTWSQMIRVLLSLGLIKIDSTRTEYIEDADLIFELVYVVPFSNASEVLINEIINSYLFGKYKSINEARKNKEYNNMCRINLGFEQFKDETDDDKNVIEEIYHNIYSYWNENQFLNTLALSIYKSSLFSDKEKPSVIETRFVKILGKEKTADFYDIDSKYYKLSTNGMVWNSNLKTVVLEMIFPGDSGKFSFVEEIPFSYMVKGRDDKNKLQFIDASAKSFGNFLFDQFQSGIKVPPYQRLYEWNQDLIVGLVHDIDEIEIDKFHYIGGVLTSNKKVQENNLDIVDGQQRITSMLIILKVIRDMVHKYFDMSVKVGLVSEFLETLFSNVENDKNRIQRLFDLSHDRNSRSFNNIMNSEFGYIPIENIEGEDRYVNNYDAVSDYISNELENYGSKPEKLRYLFDLQDKAINRTYLTITVNKINSPFYMFQRLNSSSKPLSDLDLFINFVILSFDEDEYNNNEPKILADIERYLRIPFSKVHKGKVQEGIIDEKELNNFLNTFIKYYEVMYVNKFDKEEQKEIKDKQNIRVGKSFNYFKKIIVHEKLGYFNNEKLVYKSFNKMLKDISRMVYLYKSISQKAYLEPTSKLAVLGDILITFHGRTVYFPIIFYLIQEYTEIVNNEFEFDNDSNVDFVRQVLFAIEKYENYFQVISYRGQSLSDSMAFLLNEITKLDKNDKDVFSKVIDILKSKGQFANVGLMMPSDEEFSKYLSENKLVSQKVFISLFNRIETFLYLRNGNVRKMDDVVNSVPKTWTIEHIIPQNPDDTYIMKYINDDKSVKSSAEFKELRTSNLSKIGNILMLSQKKNSSASNKPFSKKKIETYRLDSNLYNLKSYRNTLKGEIELMSIDEMETFLFSDVGERSIQLTNLLQKIYKKYK